MTLIGVSPFPPEFAARHRARGYWEDGPLTVHFLDCFARFADRTAGIGGDGWYSYAELDFIPEQEIARRKLPGSLAVLDRFPLSRDAKIPEKELTATLTSAEPARSAGPQEGARR